ncbi:hypothetical protein OIU76_022932 [Salix suchowensis]|nr:hypothetical protein OIU76_022932 [Salix suchowensis]KAJ6373661.1 hypothetical protein OIU78_029359 [Salix suchowensis]
METTPPFAPDYAAGNHSSAAEVGGVAGVIVVLILAIIYLILRRARCSMNCDVGVNEASRSGAEEYLCRGISVLYPEGGFFNSSCTIPGPNVTSIPLPPHLIKERYLINLTSSRAHSLSIIPHSFLINSDMETTPSFAPDSAAGNYSAAAKVGGVAGVILVLILAIIYVILRRGRCSMKCDMGVNEVSRSGAEEV